MVCLWLAHGPWDVDDLAVLVDDLPLRLLPLRRRERSVVVPTRTHKHTHTHTHMHTSALLEGLWR